MKRERSFIFRIVGLLLCILSMPGGAVAEAPIDASFAIAVDQSRLSGQLLFDLAGGPVRGDVTMVVAADATDPPQTEKGTETTGVFSVKIELTGTFSGAPVGVLRGTAKIGGSYTLTDGCQATIEGSGVFSGQASGPSGFAFVEADWDAVRFEGCGLASKQPFFASLPPFAFEPTNTIPPRSAEAPPLPTMRDPEILVDNAAATATGEPQKSPIDTITPETPTPPVATTAPADPMAKLPVSEPGATSTPESAEAGWIQLERIEIAADRAERFTSKTVLAAGKTYRITANGTFSAWGGEPVGIDAVWCDRAGRCVPPQAWQQLRVNNTGINDLLSARGDEPLPYNSAHQYAFALEGTGEALSLHLWDAIEVGSARGNTGTLIVEIHSKDPQRSPDPANGSGAASAATEETLTTDTQEQLPFDTIVMVQELLAALGFYDGRLDGIFNQTTRNAVSAFQASIGLTRDGRISDSLIDRIFIALEGGVVIEDDSDDLSTIIDTSGSDDAQGILSAFGVTTIEGVAVREVLPDSIAQAYGLKSGDIIVAINGGPVITVYDLVESLQYSMLDEPIEVTISRAGSELVLSNQDRVLH